MIGTKLAHECRSAVNFGERALPVDILLLHYTGMKTAQAAIDLLCAESSGVSCHYLVGDDGAITQMVCESKRAWHAGQSFWQGKTDINSCSIGIEIQNVGPDGGLPDFPDRQIETVIALSRDIMARNDIPQSRVLAHSDVAPGRKVDPGEKFPWARLAKAGVGLWPHVETVGDDHKIGVALAQGLLRRIGYDVRVSGTVDVETKRVLKAFQLRYMPHRVDGVLDGESMALIKAVDKLALSV